MDERKICTKCSVEYPRTREYYPPDKKHKDGLSSWCKKCHNKYVSDWKKKNKDRLSKSNKNSNLRRYNLTLEQYNLMFEKQNGLCAICGQPEIKRMLSVDHNHKTGKVRGLLCTTCNLWIGVIENSDFMRKANKYLKIYGEVKEAGTV